VVFGELAQLVERLLSMQEVAGSIPAFSILPFDSIVRVPQAKVVSILSLFAVVVLGSKSVPSDPDFFLMCDVRGKPTSGTVI
jgi:hypothetical protein